MICYPPSLALSQVVKRLKGTSSQHIRQQKLPEISKKLWGKAFWSPSYFVVSCGGAPLDVVKTYVEQQSPLRKKRNKPASNRKTNSILLYPRTEVRGLRAKLE
jgi:putative transposase